MTRRFEDFKRLAERRVEFTLGVSYDTPESKLAMVPAIIREAIEDQPQTRFDRAHFKQYGEPGLIFETAFYFSDPDYNRYMDAQQAINLAIYGRLHQEGVALAHPLPPIVVVTDRTQAPDEASSPTPALTHNAPH